MRITILTSYRIVLLSLFLVFLEAHGFVVNRVNGGGSVNYVDFSIPGPVIPLELSRSYNSITAISESNGWNGAFGWGWTTVFETTLTLTPERNVILRDGGTGNIVSFKPEKEDPKIQEKFYADIKRSYFEKKLGRKITDPELLGMKLPDNLLSRLRSDPQYRLELATRYALPTQIPKGEILVSSEYGYQTLQNTNNKWIREKDGITQYFDKDGRLVRQRDKNGFFVDFIYPTPQKSQVSEIVAQDKTASLRLTWRNNRIVEVADNKNHRGRFSYDELGNLVSFTGPTGTVLGYRYENKKYPHLLTRVEYISESTPNEKVTREIRYFDENGLVAFHKEKDGSETTYQYGKKPNDPENNFWTKSVKKMKGGGSEELYDEYLIKARTDGSKYLYKQENILNGVTTTTIFAACCGKPTQITKNGEVTNFKYYENGLLKEKIGPNEETRLEYDPRWRKVTKISQNGLVSTYVYDDRGNLTKASNSKSQKVTLKYDRFGRISELINGQGKQLLFQYGDQGKPTLISEKGLGTLRIEYDSSGKVKKTETLLARKAGRTPSEAAAQQVTKQIFTAFQQLLDIIRPAGVNLISG